MAGKEFHFNALQAILTDIGLNSAQANTIASASQAIDDFYEEKLITFENGELFYPIVTAHEMLDADNLDSRDASNIWMPFHFFPDHHGVCKPDTDNVKKLVNYVKEYAYTNEMEKSLLHGILLHIYVDTFTHEGFMGLHCKHNDISDLDDEETWNILSPCANFPPAIGHGEALTYPDDMWRRWSYADNSGETIRRDNQNIFLTVTNRIQPLMKELGYEVTALSELQQEKYKRIFAMKGGKNYESEVAAAFDAITQSNAFPSTDIEYQHWKKNVMRKLPGKGNKYKREIPLDAFYSSQWVVFQRLAKDVRTFFKKEIFSEIRLKTRVY